jgi:hypothetical protein
MDKNEIEVQIPIQIEADINVHINRNKWNKMTKEQKSALMDECITEAYAYFADDCIRLRPGLNISAVLVGPDLGSADPGNVTVYDPEVA